MDVVGTQAQPGGYGAHCLGEAFPTSPHRVHVDHHIARMQQGADAGFYV